MSQLSKLLGYQWLVDQLEDPEDKELYESNFHNSRRTREVVRIYIQHELDKLDKECSLAKLKGVADRAELALMAAAQREVLLKLQDLLLDDE